MSPPKNSKEFFSASGKRHERTQDASISGTKRRVTRKTLEPTTPSGELIEMQIVLKRRKNAR